jgi:diacylglycerol kinase (ATP)
MQNPEPLKLLFVINPVSGGKEKNDWESSIRGYFKEKPHNIEFYLLTGTDDKTSVQHHIESIKPSRVVAVGGDGTVKMMAELLKETTMTLGILPAGSANGMAKELGIPLTVEEALNIVVDGDCKKIDAIKINEEEICIHVSDIGLNAMLVKEFEKSKKRGMWNYGKAIFKALWQIKKMKVVIKTDKETVMRNAYMVALANARKYGTGANINPDGNVADGKFEVVIVRKLNVFEIMKAIFTNRSFYPQRIEVFPTTNLELNIRHKVYFQVDGEYKGKIANIKARVLPQIIQVMVPAEQQNKLA